jgi:hypothetical protein
MVWFSNKKDEELLRCNDTHRANIFNQKWRSGIKREAKVSQKITKNLRTIFAM